MSAATKALGDFARVAWQDWVRSPDMSVSPEQSLLKAEAWLCRAQDVSGDGGVSYGYSVRGGWRPSYPETSGYVATTFLRLARDRDTAYRARALRILHWLVRVQNLDGSFANPRFGPAGIVFDTGQILFGLVAGFEVTGDGVFLEAARRAARWLVGIADSQGHWTRNEFMGTPHVYNTRTAWALLRMNEVEFDNVRERVARTNLDWAVESQTPAGFFDHCAFRRGDVPYTHTIAYATRGLLEAACLLDDDRYLAAATRCAYATLGRLHDDGFLASTISIEGRPMSTACCLTGNCQFAIIWARLLAVDPASCLRTGMVRAVGYVAARQDVRSRNPDICGGIKGSHPVWGRYAFLSYPNWATKFFIDAMWLRQQVG